MKNHLFISMLFYCLNLNSQINVHSLDFDGVNDYVEYSNQIIIPSLPVSIQADVKLPIGFSSNSNFFYSVFISDDSNGSYYGFWCTISSSTVEVSYGDGLGQNVNSRHSLITPHSIPENTWVNIACSIISETEMHVYIDGGEISGAYSGLGGLYSSSGGNSSFSGRLLSQSNAIFSQGKLDNLSIWDIDLSESSINQYITCPPIGTEFGLVSFYNFEEGTGFITSDITGNGHNGSLMNGVNWSTDVPINNCDAGLDILSKIDNNKIIVGYFDMLGRKTDYKPNVLLLYKYSDGSIEKHILLN